MADKLRDLAKTIRSKNAGVDHITFDIIFADRGHFERVRDSGVLNAGTVARLFAIDQDRGRPLHRVSNRPTPLSSPSGACVPAAAPVNGMSSARSNTPRCSTSRFLSVARR